MSKIQIPYPISRKERADIEKCYIEIFESAGPEKVEYISTNLGRVLKRLYKSEELWHGELAYFASQLNEVLTKSSDDFNDVNRHVISALHYLCAPLEIIPDHVPGKGYADDALVMNKCLAHLKLLGVTFDPKE